MADDNDKQKEVKPPKAAPETTPAQSGFWYTGKDGKLTDKPPGPKVSG